ncbi:MAG TPA: Rv1535 domain-containing protein [Mycobacterium sp.]|nr:Rv1535 domain-containing protein [Mycobacterium sp.]
MAVAVSTDVRVRTPGSGVHASPARAARPVRRGGAAWGAAAVGPTDPFAEVLARALTGPLRECYALLWRVGVLQIID